MSLSLPWTHEYTKYQFRNLAATVQSITGDVAGALKGLTIINNSGATAWIQMFDAKKAAVVLGTTEPDWQLEIANATQYDMRLPQAAGIGFNTGLAIAATTTDKGNTGSSNGVLVYAAYA